MKGAEPHTRFAMYRVSVQQLVPLMTPNKAPDLERIFSTAELDSCRTRKGGAESLAARYAAKCAILEVLGETADQLERLGPHLTFQRMASGQPVLDAGAQRILPAESSLSISMTHSSSLAIAAVVLSRYHLSPRGQSLPECT